MNNLFLQSVRLKDFRTFGDFKTQIVPAPGLTLLVGTNGLGKSSFFDALEWGLTGEVRRFKSYMAGTDEGKYLTRRGAEAGSHSVHLSFTDDSIVNREPQKKPKPSDVIKLLKKAEWTAQIRDIGTYLAFTHFLGQAAQQRFTSRDQAEQWESLKGPSGIDRLDEVRRGLRGRATEMAFTRRIRRERDDVVAADRLLVEWRDLASRVTRLKEASTNSGGLSSEVFSDRLAHLASAVRALAPSLSDQDAPGTLLAAVRSELDSLREQSANRRAILESLSDIPARYASEGPIADVHGATLAAVRDAEQSELRAMDTATASVRTARERLGASATEVASRDSAIRRLEDARADIEGTVRTNAALLQLEAVREETNAALMQQRKDSADLDSEIAAIQRQRATLDGLAAAARSATTLAELAKQLPIVRARATASATVLEAIDRTGTTVRLVALTDRHNMITSEAVGAKIRLESARARASAVDAAVATISSHIHDDDLDCPVCGSHFVLGQLKLLAMEAANAKDVTLANAEQKHAELVRQQTETSREIDELTRVVHSADLARAAAEADRSAASELEARVAAALPNDAWDLVASAEEAQAKATSSLSSAQASELSDEALLADKSARRDSVRQTIAELEGRLIALNEKITALSDDRRTARERLEAAGQQDESLDSVTASLTVARDLRLEAERDRSTAEVALRMALEDETAARSRHRNAQEELMRSTSTQVAAAEAQHALETRWRDGGLEGPPSAASLEVALQRLANTSRDVERLEVERSLLASALEVANRDREYFDLATQMEKTGGDSAAVDPKPHESVLLSRCDAARAALRLTESTHTAVEAFADKLREEASNFSTQFLTPLNGLIGDFNEALLSTPGETIQLNAAYHKDRTQFDMGLHYRDPLEDALYDTGLPPQVVLSEGQLAANGFSILCSASTAYPWSRWRALLMDDPLQHNDIIHAAAFVDLMRNLVDLESYQLIMSSHDRGEAEFIRRKFDAANLPCSVIELTAPSKAGVRYLPPDHNGAAREILAGATA